MLYAPGEFLIALGKSAHEEHRFTVGMELSGVSLPVDDPELEAAGYYRTSGIRVMGMVESDSEAPPFLGVPPSLETYRSRGHRRLDARTYDAKMHGLYLGLSYAGGDDRGPLEPDAEEIPL